MSGTIYFTQFIFPDGRLKEVWVDDMPDEIVAMADELRKAFWSFEIECHPGEQIVHADCCDEEAPIADEVCPNGPEVPVMVQKLVQGAHAEWVRRGRPEAKGRRLEVVLRRLEREMYH